MTLKPVHVLPDTDAAELDAAIALLNSRGVHINTRGADGVSRTLTSATVIALAELVRALDRKTSSEDK